MNGTATNELDGTMIVWVTRQAGEYASRIFPLLGVPELTGHSDEMFNKKGAAIRSSDGLDDALISRWMTVSEQLVTRAVGV